MRKFRYMLYALLFFGMVTASFLFGRASAPASYKETVTFYATVSYIDQDSFVVSALEINDINHRSRFHLGFGSSTLFIHGDSYITREDFDVGDMVSVTYKLPITLNFADVLRLELLDDEL